MGDVLGSMNTVNVKRGLNLNAATVEESAALRSEGVRLARKQRKSKKLKQLKDSHMPKQPKK